MLEGRLLARLLRAWRGWVDATLSCARGSGRRRGGGRGREQFVVVAGTLKALESALWQGYTPVA